MVIYDLDTDEFGLNTWRMCLFGCYLVCNCGAVFMVVNLLLVVWLVDRSWVCWCFACLIRFDW